MFSQDTLFFINGEKQTAKIKEINSTQIKYLKFDNLNGPTYSLNKSGVAIIKYFGGQIDSFNVIEPPTVVVSEPKVNKKMSYNGASIMHNSEKIRNYEFVSLINNYPDEKARKKMQHSYKQMIGHRDIATASLSCGLIFKLCCCSGNCTFCYGIN